MCNDNAQTSICNLKTWTTQSGITEISSTGTLIDKNQLYSVTTLSTPKAVAELKAGDRIYFYIIIPDIQMDGINNRGFSGFDRDGARFDNITKSANGIDYLAFSKFVSIRKL